MTPIPKHVKLGWLYLVRGPDGLHKIGFTYDVKRRFVGLRFEYGPAVELVRAVEVVTPRNGEWAMHRTFRGKRVRGEWFDLDDDDLAVFHERADREAKVAAAVRDYYGDSADVRSCQNGHSDV